MSHHTCQVQNIFLVRKHTKNTNGQACKIQCLKSQIARQWKDNLMAQAVTLTSFTRQKRPRLLEESQLHFKQFARPFLMTTSQGHKSKSIWTTILWPGLAKEEEVSQKPMGWRAGWPTQSKILLSSLSLNWYFGDFHSVLGSFRNMQSTSWGLALGTFPGDGLGKNWATCLIMKHYDQLGMYWSSALDGSCGRAVNPVTNDEYFTILKQVREDFNIPDELVYGADETGIQTGIGVTEHVIGPADANMQHQQQSGNRENITVLPTICADGTSLPPTVIYKGESFQTKWLQENPLDARCVPFNVCWRCTELICVRMGYQKKGYTSGKIGVAWLQDWDKLTKQKANGQHHLLILDGHSSHYTLGFLDYACKNAVIVLCYPISYSITRYRLRVERL